ncbi:hypothetical protein G6F31_014607 [Rhizopus arrhizus]|nr:hypothetical protein G6F31_014607 [Rhizopus arrhizus]
MVLSLDRSLSDTYWLNVNDPGFPYVGVIEHTNFEPPSSYGGRHIVYLSKYLPPHHPMYTMSDAELVEFSIPHLQKMFPEFDRSWIQDLHVWRADYAQPIAEKHYSKLIPGRCTPISNVFVTSMAQVYPEDRGTNYAVLSARNGSAHWRSLFVTLGGWLAISIVTLWLLLQVPAVRTGDGSEYYAMEVALSASKHPYLTEADWNAYDTLYLSGTIESMVPTDTLKQSFPALVKDGQWDFNHFWMYPLLASIVAEPLP